MPTDTLIQSIRRAHAAGIKTITFLGGEPTFARSDLSVVLEECSTLGVEISINSNLLDYDLVMPLLKFKSLKNITVSLDGASEETHDLMRGKGTFKRTYGNLIKLCDYERVRCKNLSVDITFVLTNLNRKDNTRIVDLSNGLNVRKLNLETLKYKSYAEANSRKVAIRGKDLIVALTEVYLYWMLVGVTELDLYIPPIFAAFLKERYGLSNIAANSKGCGGTNVYGYVDNYGNHLPCPSMAFENNSSSALKSAAEAISIINKDVEAIWERSTFKGFERARVKGYFKRSQKPCDCCKFLNECHPCTSDVIERRANPTVDICQAIKDFGDQFVDGFAQRHFVS
jgi:MoaA/NifB/PqqE/SkfB family radical SAM enzyme